MAQARPERARARSLRTWDNLMLLEVSLSFVVLRVEPRLHMCQASSLFPSSIPSPLLKILTSVHDVPCLFEMWPHYIVLAEKGLFFF